MSTKDLIERLRDQYRDTKRMLPNELCHEAADALERLTQPVVVVEPVARANERAPWVDLDLPEHYGSMDLYSAETVARLIAERDEAQVVEAMRDEELAAVREMAGNASIERDALQKQVKMLRDALLYERNLYLEADSDINEAGLEALAATEPKGEKE